MKSILKKINLWGLFDRTVDPYPLVRPFLFMLDPEDAHDVTMKMLALGLGPHFHGPDDPVLKTHLFGLDFPNPIGLGAGLDKHATSIDEVMGFGFGSVEIGGVTPLPQPGNPRPRMFRLPDQKALINRFGFNSVGADVFTQRLKAWRARADRTRNPVGVNLGKNKETTDDAADFLKGLQSVAPYVDYVTVNISSPNTPGLRDLQTKERMSALLRRVTDKRDEVAPKLPVLVKIAPDLTPAQQEDIAAVILDSALQGVIVGNTSFERPSSVPPELAKEAGGLSGPLMFDHIQKLHTNMYKLIGGKMPLIASGGVNTGAQAYARLRAGASLVQIYTALIYGGPLSVQKIKRDLAALLRRDGFSSVAEAVGVDCR